MLAECGYDITGIDVSRAMANAANCAAELVAMQREGFTPEVFAYWESDASAGPWIDPDVTRRLGECGLTLLFDVYKVD